MKQQIRDLEYKVRALQDTFGSMQRYISSSMFEQQPSTHKNGRYKFIPFGTGAVMDQLLSVKDYLMGRDKKLNPWLNDYKFLDAGCGYGNILMLAHGVGFRSYGLEINRVLIGRAKLINPFWKDIKHRDILKYNSYGDFDVIYYYCPLRNNKLETRFEERVEDQMKVGSILMPNLKASRRIRKDERFKQSKIRNGYVFFEKISEEESVHHPDKPRKTNRRLELNFESTDYIEHITKEV